MTWLILKHDWTKKVTLNKSNMKTILRIFAVIFYASFIWFKFSNDESENNQNNNWRFKKFSMEIGHDEWTGKLEQGEYTKSGILKIKQNEK